MLNFFQGKNSEKFSSIYSIWDFKSKNDNVIWLDADFQHPPKYIKKFIKKIKYYDVIIYSRYLRFTKQGKSFHDNSTSILNKFCNKFLFNDFTDFTSGFICIKKNV